jgi:hypothetical protein
MSTPVYNTEQKALLIEAVVSRLKFEIADSDAFPMVRPATLPVFLAVGACGNRKKPASIDDLVRVTDVTVTPEKVYPALHQLAGLLPLYGSSLRLRRCRIPGRGKAWGYWLEMRDRKNDA